MNYLKLIRYQNLLLLAFMQLIFRYGFLKFQNIFLSLTDLQYGLLVLSTVLIAAAGYIINDIMDQETDYDNNPESAIVGKSISEKSAYNLYFVLNISGVGVGYYVKDDVRADLTFDHYFNPTFKGKVLRGRLYQKAIKTRSFIKIFYR